MSVIRFTIIDRDGTASFVGPCHAIKMVAAACSRHPEDLEELLAYARPYDSEFIDTVRYGLAIFDEHNTQDDARAFRSILDTTPSRELPPFRVLDAATKAASLEPAGTGLLLFNLEARRIVQVQNSYAQLLRQDRGRIRRNGQPTRILYHYRLPDDWSIVP